jgi:anti-sigma factor RsiW
MQTMGRDSEGRSFDGCPSLEQISRFIDGELDAHDANHVAAHTAVCARCEELMKMGDLRPQPSAMETHPGWTCAGGPTAEDLVAYVTGAAVDGTIEEHLLTCAACVESVAIIHNRLRVGAVAAVPVPSALQERIRSWPSELRKRTPRWRAAVGTGLAAARRLPVLMPLSFAAGALLALFVEQLWPEVEVPHPVTRSVVTRRELAVTAPEGQLRSEPHPRSAIIATLNRGTKIEVLAEYRDWYRVRLLDGSEGWVERRAFE